MPTWFNGGMEEVLAGHPDAAECAVIGVCDALKGQMPRPYAVWAMRGLDGRL